MKDWKMSARIPNPKLWLLIAGLFMVFSGWFSHFGDKGWWELIERPDRVAPLLSGIGAVLLRHFGSRFVN